MQAWEAFAVSLGAAPLAAFALLFSMADGGASARATLIAGGVAGAATVVLVFWLAWGRWWVTQQRARRGTRNTHDEP
jgi:hypothetical protein